MVYTRAMYDEHGCLCLLFWLLCEAPRLLTRHPFLVVARIVYRSTHWVHIASAALAALDASGARELYDTLRAAYNPFRPPGSPPVPPLEEWQGVSAICEDTYCRYALGGFFPA